MNHPLVLAAALALAGAVPAGAEPPASEPPRAAVVVGATGKAAGRAQLRYARRDAEVMAETLVSVGGFPRDRVHLLRDPSPADLLAALRGAAAALGGRRDALLLFYFSGHADRTALYSGGQPVSLDEIRQALDRQDIGVRIGVVDACQGGGWTRAKGLVPEEPFEVSVPNILDSEGSALLSASTGDETAHESDSLAGSYFTVHLTAGMRGAADENGDGDVTLTEAFEFARQQTVRETSRRAREPQHPSFALNLRGRQDVVLSRPDTSPSTLAVDQTEGPLEVVHLASGLRLLELAPGARHARLALPAGRYLVRKLGPDGPLVREVNVPRRGLAEVREAELVLVADERLSVKGKAGGWSRTGTLPRGIWGLSLGMAASSDPQAPDTVRGIQTGDWPADWNPALVQLDARLGITDRLTWKVGTLGLAYRFGEPDGWEVVPYGGLLGWKARSAPGALTGRLGAGLGVRRTVGSWAIVATAGLDTERVFPLGERDLDGWPRPSEEAEARLRVSVGYARRWGDDLQLHLGAGAVQSRVSFPLRGQLLVVLGSVQGLGLANPPLLRYRVGQAAIDLFAAVALGRRYPVGSTKREGLLANVSASARVTREF